MPSAGMHEGLVQVWQIGGDASYTSLHLNHDNARWYHAVLIQKFGADKVQKIGTIGRIFISDALYDQLQELTNGTIERFEMPIPDEGPWPTGRDLDAATRPFGRPRLL